MTEVAHYINGTLTSGNPSGMQDVYNPATGEVSGQLALASACALCACAFSQNSVPSHGNPNHAGARFRSNGLTC